MFYILFFSIVFFVVYIAFSLVYEDALRKDKKTIKEIAVAKKIFDLDEKKIDNKRFLKEIAFINSFIIAITVIVVDLIGLNSFLWLPIAFGLILILIFSCYFIYGKILHRKWGNDKDDKKL